MMQRCPYCTEVIPDEALVCKHCHRAVVPIGLDREVALMLVPDTGRRIAGALLAIAGLVAAIASPIARGPFVLAGIVFVWAAVVISLRTKPFIRYAGGFLFATAVVAVIARLVGGP